VELLLERVSAYNKSASSEYV